MESVLEEQRRLMRRMMRHNGNLRSLWRKYAASPLEDRCEGPNEDCTLWLWLCYVVLLSSMQTCSLICCWVGFCCS